jgi:hypothetical protein
MASARLLGQMGPDVLVAMFGVAPSNLFLIPALNLYGLPCPSR